MKELCDPNEDPETNNLWLGGCELEEFMVKHESLQVIRRILGEWQVKHECRVPGLGWYNAMRGSNDVRNAGVKKERSKRNLRSLFSPCLDPAFSWLKWLREE